MAGAKVVNPHPRTLQIHVTRFESALKSRYLRRSGTTEADWLREREDLLAAEQVRLLQIGATRADDEGPATRSGSVARSKPDAAPEFEEFGESIGARA